MFSYSHAYFLLNITTTITTTDELHVKPVALSVDWPDP